LSIIAPTLPKAFSTLPATVAAATESTHRRPRQSIRDLKEEKNPDQANQMAALVAFYLSEVADAGERKDLIDSSDIVKYFKQASFKLPKVVRQTLPNAASAGYLDAVGNGLFKLNPVGYNLVVHGLPRGQNVVQRRVRRKSKRGKRA
jgi:hypothetical protein